MNSLLLDPRRFLSTWWREVAVGTVVSAALLWAFWPTLTELVDRWSHDSQYSHGFLVPLFSAYLLWSRGKTVDFAAFRPAWWGFPIVLAALAIHFGGIYLFITWLNGLALIPCLAGLCVLAGGPRAIKWAWPAIVFLVFMMPMSFSMQQWLSGPLQRVGTVTSTYILQTFGFTVAAQGNVIHMGEVRLGVVEACSGLNMLLSFVALCTAVAIIVRRPVLDKGVLFLSAIPIAVACNVIRITVTAIVHKVAGRWLADLIFHDLAGWLMMPLALGMLWLELKLWSRIMIPPPKRDHVPVVPRVAFSRKKRPLSRTRS